MILLPVFLYIDILLLICNKELGTNLYLMELLGIIIVEVIMHVRYLWNK